MMHELGIWVLSSIYVSPGNQSNYNKFQVEGMALTLLKQPKTKGPGGSRSDPLLSLKATVSLLIFFFFLLANKIVFSDKVSLFSFLSILLILCWYNFVILIWLQWLWREVSELQHKYYDLFHNSVVFQYLCPCSQLRSSHTLSSGTEDIGMSSKGEEQLHVTL